jgi:ABC-type molybdate transport system permease subunit
MLSETDISAISVTIKLALLSTAILIAIGTPLAWWLSQTKFKFKVIFEGYYCIASDTAANRIRLLFTNDIRLQ